MSAASNGDRGEHTIPAIDVTASVSTSFPIPDPGKAQVHAAVVSITTLVVSVANYAFTLLLLRLLAAPDYVAYASIQSLLLVLGSGGMAAIPWAVARHVALTPTARAAGEALGFGLVASSVQGLAFAALSFALVVPVSGVALAGAAGVAAFALSVISAPLGLLQGQGRSITISALRLTETIVRIGLSIALVLTVAASPLSPVVGFISGSVVLFAAALLSCRGAWPPRAAARATYHALLRHSALLGIIQLALAALGTLDTAVIAVTELPAVDARDYQIAALLGRVPLFLGTAAAMTFYPQIASSPSVVASHQLQARATRLIVVLGVPVAVLIATLPEWVIGLIAPGREEEVGGLLPVTALTGATVALTTVLACARQATQEYRRVVVLLMPFVAVEPLVLAAAGNLGTATTFAVSAASIAVLVVAVVIIDLRSWRPWSSLSLTDVTGLASVMVLAAVGHEIAWLWWAATCTAMILCGRAILVPRHDDRTSG